MNKNKITKVLFISAIVTVSCVSLSMINIDSVSALGSNIYYKTITLSNANNSYPMFINVTNSTGGDVNCSSHCNSNFSDIRFEDNARATYCDYWVEYKVDDNYAHIWVELPSDVEDDNSIVISYGGDNDTSMSNGSEVFTYFDDWTLDNTGEWQVNIGGGGNTVYYTEDGTYEGLNTRIRYSMNFTTWGDVTGSDEPATQIRYQSCRDSAAGSSCGNYAELNLKPTSSKQDSDGETNPGDDDHWAYRVSIHDYDGEEVGKSNWCYNPEGTNAACGVFDDFLTFEHLHTESLLNISVYGKENHSLILTGIEDEIMPEEGELIYLTIAFTDDGDTHDFDWVGGDYLYCYVEIGGHEVENYIDWMFVSTYYETEPTVSTVGAEQSGEGISFISINGGVNATEIHDTTPTIIWTKINDASVYWLQIDNNNDFSSPEINLTDINAVNYPAHCVIGTNVSFTIPEANKLTSYEVYYMRVRSKTLE